MNTDPHARWVSQVLARARGGPSGVFTLQDATCLGERQSDGSTRLIVRATWLVDIERPPGQLELHTRVEGASWLNFAPGAGFDGLAVPSGELWNDERRAATKTRLPHVCEALAGQVVVQCQPTM